MSKGAKLLLVVVVVDVLPGYVFFFGIMSACLPAMIEFLSMNAAKCRNGLTTRNNCETCWERTCGVKASTEVYIEKCTC